MRSWASFSFCRSRCRLFSLWSKAWCVSNAGQLHRAKTLFDFSPWMMSSLKGDEQRDCDALDFEVSVLSRDEVSPLFAPAWRPSSAGVRILSSETVTGDALIIHSNHQTSKLYFVVCTCYLTIILLSFKVRMMIKIPPKLCLIVKSSTSVRCLTTLISLNLGLLQSTHQFFHWTLESLLSPT